MIERVNIEIDLNAAFAERNATLVKSLQMVVHGCVKGDIAEFGVGPGISLGVLACALAGLNDVDKRYGHPPRRFDAFDSFEGFPASLAAPDQDAPMVQNGTWSAGQGVGISAGEAYLRMATHLGDRAGVCSGYFSDSLGDIPGDKRYALVHLDCDLFKSTRDVLCHLIAFGHLSDGCCLLFDDFLENRGSPYLGQRAAWETVKDIPHTSLGPYGRAGWRFIVHGAE